MFGSDSDEKNNNGDEQVFYNKKFVNQFYAIKTFQECATVIGTQFKDKGKNPTDFTSDFPDLLEKGLDYRDELLEKHKENLETLPNDMILAQCVTDYGIFKNLKDDKPEKPTKDDYIFHITFGLLQACCQNDKVPAIVPRIILNNLAIKMMDEEIKMVSPRHQNWAIDIFDKIRSDLVPDFITKLKLTTLITPEILIDITKKMLAQNRFNDASLMIVRYKFQEHFDVNFIMMRLVDLNKIDTAKLLIHNDVVQQKALIGKLSTNEHCKKASQLVKDFKLSIDEFPELKERIMKQSMRYFLGRNLYKKSNQQDFLTLDRIEDLLSGIKQMMGYFVEDLAHKNKTMEAKGICERNGVQGFIRQDITDILAKVEYDVTKDTSLQKIDAFAPMSQPVADYISLPEFVKLEWIGTEEDVPKLEVLLEDEFIGVDSEWRPQLTQLHKTKPSLFQISGSKNAFLIDLVSLQKSKVLDGMLSKVFSNQNSTIIGFGFSSDIEQFARKLPNLNFIKYVKNFIDAQTYFGKIYLVEQQTGLAKVALKIFEKQVCKVEQMSNWERRPLRQSQQHYGATDAYILIDIIKHLIERAKQNNMPPFHKYVKTLDNTKMRISADYDSDLENEEETKTDDRKNERINVKHRKGGGKKQHFNKGGENKNDNTYGNSFGRSGIANNLQLIVNDELRASMWQTHGFIVDRNLQKLCKILQEARIDCIQIESQDSEQICNKAMEKDRVFITSNLKLFNRKSVMNRCCVHYKDSPQKQFQCLQSFFSFE